MRIMTCRARLNRMADMSERWKRKEQRHREAATLAEQLIGLNKDDAVERAEGEGFKVRALPESFDGVLTMEFIANRVNLTYAPDGTVIRASAG